MSWLLILVLLIPELVFAGTITRPVKSNGSTNYTNGMIPQDTDLNGDINTIYSEFNGNISNANISASAAIAASKINADGLTANVRVVHAAPCYIWEESDQAADSKKWAACVVGGEFRLSTWSDASGTQNDWVKINRSNGGVTLSGSGTNTITGPTTFNQLVTFNGGNTLMPTGAVVPYISTTPPAGWLNMNGASNSCTGASGVNGPLCALLVVQHPGINYKGTANGTFTVDTGSDEIIRAAHGLSVNDRVHFSTTTTLPSPLVSTTVYYVISVTTDRYKISTTSGGASVNITTTGSGTHSDYDKFVTPNMSSRMVIGVGTGAGLSARSLGQTGGEENHLLTTAEMPSHNHSGGMTAGSNGPAGGGTINYALGQPTGNTGSGATHNVMNPFLALQYIIKL